MKLLALLIMIVSFANCAHHHNKNEHHHHQFNKKCAYSVSQDHLDVEGKEEFKLEHGKETYYFSSEENMQKFKKDINTNIERSKRNWRRGPPGSGARR